MSDEELLKKENLTLNSYNEQFKDISNKANSLKEKIEKEISEIDNLYDKVNNEMKISFKKKHEKLIKEENELKEKLQNEVTKVKEQLENFLSESNTIIKNNEKINKGMKQFENDADKNMIRTLSYISKVNKINKKMTAFNQKLMKNLKISYEEDKSSIKYEEYYFSGIQMPKEIEFKDIKYKNFKMFWKMDNINIKDIDNNKIKYKVEARKENSDEKFIQKYEGSENSCLVDNLNSNTNYEIRICCFYNNVIGPWSEIHKIKTMFYLNESIILKDDIENINLIKGWVDPNRDLDFKLLFRMSRDGSNCSDFHRLCDNKGETLIIIKTDKNYKFGAYTPLNWVTPSSGEVSNPKDELTFLFSLDKKQKFTKIPGKNPTTARSQKNYGPLLGSATDLGIESDMKNGWCGNGTFLRNYELTNGESCFTINEMEIFQVFNTN